MEPIYNQFRQKATLDAKGKQVWSLIKLPEDFHTSGKKYFAVIFFPGNGETGSVTNAGDLKKLLTHGPSGFVNKGEKFVITHPVSGEKEDMIIISLQQEPNSVISPAETGYFLKNDPVIKDRIKGVFITGLSQGGCCATQYIRPSQAKFIKENNVLGIVAASPAKWGSAEWNLSPRENVYKAFNETGTPVLNFVGDKEESRFLTFGREMGQHIKTPNSEFILRPGLGHTGWADIFNPSKTWVERGGKKLNIYEWMLSNIPAVSKRQAPPTMEVNITGPKITESTVIDLGSVKINYTVQ